MHATALPRFRESLTPFARSVADGLRAQPKRLSPSWLYDDLGSALFEAICALPWYRVTRAERELLERDASSLGRACAGVTFTVELGPGSGEKLALLLRALSEHGTPPAVHLVDVSPAALSLASRTLIRAGIHDLSTVCADYADGIDTLDRYRRRPGPALVAFLGSNLGNFHWREAIELLRRLRAHLRPGDRVLLGIDLVKPVSDLLAAYDDPLGVTAAFNRNLLVRMNRELGADFTLESFAHRVLWNAAASRVEMHLESLQRQVVTIPAAELVAHFAVGETIWTESSYKFEPSQLDALGAAAGLSLARTWLHPARFSLALFDVPS
jgi:dimethylhistidine N-methyltransferase